MSALRGPRLGLLLAVAWSALAIACTAGCWIASTAAEWLQAFSVVAVLALASRFLALPAIGWAWLLGRLLLASLLVGVAALVRAANWVGHAISVSDVWFTVVAVLLAIAVGYSRRGAVRQPAAVTLLAPLAGRWVVAEGETKAFNHHWPAPAQRAALDLVRIQGLRDAVHDRFSSFGQPVKSPVDGVVVQAVDGHRDGEPAGPNGAAGNHVVLQASSGERILLAHLRRGSVAVHKGETVQAGDLLGNVGNSGSSSEPHLHVHIVSTGGGARRVQFATDAGPFRKGDVIRFGEEPHRARQPRSSSVTANDQPGTAE